MESVQKIYPTIEELSTVNSTVRCTEEGCTGIFMSESNLNLHLMKTHKKENLLVPCSAVREYYCPELSCSYNNAKSFKSLKLLKQHYLKVHSDKSFGCDTCDMKFSTQAAKNSHVEYCKAKFNCCECNASYSSYESLLTHGRRKKHIILDKTQYKTYVKMLSKSNSIANIMEKTKKNVLVLPKTSASVQVINVNNVANLLMCEKGSQTEKPRLTKRNLNSVNNSRETQTNKRHLSAETQTIGDYVSKKSSSVAKLDDDDRKSIKTQTKRVDSMTKSCNTLFNYDFDLENENAERNSAGTQTIIPQEFDLNELEFMRSSSSQTSFNEEMDTFNSENYFNCNSETQTDFMSMLNNDYCSNMYTQTCDDLFLNELAFMNSHTQTAFDDMLRSVESQTMMSSHCSKVVLSCRAMGHMETQTDVEFKQMLEEINA